MCVLCDGGIGVCDIPLHICVCVRDSIICLHVIPHTAEQHTHTHTHTHSIASALWKSACKRTLTNAPLLLNY